MPVDFFYVFHSIRKVERKIVNKITAEKFKTRTRQKIAQSIYNDTSHKVTFKIELRYKVHR